MTSMKAVTKHKTACKICYSWRHNRTKDCERFETSR